MLLRKTVLHQKDLFAESPRRGKSSLKITISPFGCYSITVEVIALEAEPDKTTLLSRSLKNINDATLLLEYDRQDSV